MMTSARREDDRVPPLTPFSLQVKEPGWELTLERPPPDFPPGKKNLAETLYLPC